MSSVLFLSAVDGDNLGGSSGCKLTINELKRLGDSPRGPFMGYGNHLDTIRASGSLKVIPLGGNKEEK